MRRVGRVRIELMVKQRRGGFIKRAAQPEDQHVRAALGATLGADDERADPGPLKLSGHRMRAVIRRALCARLVHAISKRRSDP